ncbi:hypothetical protein SDC9_206640 [bioreactor metagenome]|uniref:Uncharacterized protein n=1 Tax=bioreactor metagenome TaxID=1076179 RepID=A0A645JET5_9ZZZZ
MIVNKTDFRKLKDSIKKSINDSIAKSDSTKILIGTAKLGKKTYVNLHDNNKWEYKSQKNTKNTKSTQQQVRTLMQNFEKSQRQETSYAPSDVCGALTKKGGRCQRKVKGGGRCWQH